MTAANDKTGGYTLPLEMFAGALAAWRAPDRHRRRQQDLGPRTFGCDAHHRLRARDTAPQQIRRRRRAPAGAGGGARDRRLRGRPARQPRRLAGPPRPGHPRLRAQPGQLTPLPILLWDERLSTAAAERALLEADASRKRRAEVIDKVAATLILQGALDRMRSLHAP